MIEKNKCAVCVTACNDYVRASARPFYSTKVETASIKKFSFFFKKFQKGIDKWIQVWYNVYITGKHKTPHKRKGKHNEELLEVYYDRRYL